MTISTPWIKSALNKGEIVKGLMVTEFRTPMLGAILDAVKADFAIIDQEHGAYSADMLGSLVAGFRNGHCQPFVRVPEIRRDCFLTPLELGVSGIVVPRVETRAQAESIVHFSKYPPVGERGVSLNRAHTQFNRVTASDYMPMANDDVLVAVQIETRPALDALDDILSVPGIDMAFIGPSDLSVSLGISSNLKNPDMAAIVDKIAEAAKRNGCHLGLHSGDAESVRRLYGKGLNLLSCSTDLASFTGGFRSALSAVVSEGSFDAT